MKIKPYIVNHSRGCFVWVTPAIVCTVGGPFKKRMVDVAFHWITFGFGLCIEW